MSSLFGTSDNTHATSANTQSGQSATGSQQQGVTNNATNQIGATNNQGQQSNVLAPILTQYANQVSSQFNPSNIANATVQANSAQTGAANNLGALGAGSSLGTAYGAANNVAANGITPSSINSFMSPYIQNVVDSTQHQFDLNNATAQQSQQSRQASQGALGNSNNNVSRALLANAQQTAQAPVIAGLYNSGYGQAAGLAGQSAGLQLQGASTAGGLTNSQTAANTALANSGQNLASLAQWNTNNPFNLTSQGSSAFSPLTAAGNTTSNTGTTAQTGQQVGSTAANTQGQSQFVGQSNGSSDSSTTHNPSLFDIGAGLIGGAISAFPSGGVRPSGYSTTAADGGRIPREARALGGEVINLDPVLIGHMQSQPMDGFRKGYWGAGTVSDDVDSRAAAQEGLDGHDPRLGWIDGPNRMGLPSYHPGEIRQADPAWVHGGLAGVKAANAIEGLGHAGQNMILAPYHAGEAVGEAINDPSLPNVTNAATRTGMALFQPGKAVGALGLGYGAALAKDAGLTLPTFTSSANAADGMIDPLDPASRKRLTQLQKQDSLTKAEREEKNALTAIVAEKAKAAAQAEADIAREKAKVAADIERSKGMSGQDEYNRAVANAEKARDAALAKDKMFADSETGKLYEKTGGFAPMALGALGGFGQGFIKGGGTVAKDYLLPAAEGAGLTFAGLNAPFVYDALSAPARNPTREAYEAYARELPPDHPRKKEFADYAGGLPETNPVADRAWDQVTSPTALARRGVAAIAEGAPAGIFGANVGSLGKGMASRAGEVPGALLTSYHKGMGEAATAREAARDVGRTAAEARQLEQGAVPGPIASARASAEPVISPFPGMASSESSAVADAIAARDLARQSAPGPSPTREALANDEVSNALRLNGKIIPDSHELVPGDNLRNRLRHRDTKKFAPYTVLKDEPKALPANGKAKTNDPNDESYWEGLNTRGQKYGGIVDRYANGGRTGYETARSTHEPVITGPVMGATGGREDAKPVSVPSGSYVLPADFVSSVGGAGGNTLAGMKAIERIFGKSGHGYAAGGTPSGVPIRISDGEYALGPDQVAKAGGGDVNHGHRVLDALVKKVRAEHIKTLKSLPAPSR